jgi:hypothetical protein
LIGRIALVIAAALVAVWMLWRFLPALAWAAVLAIATWPLRRPNHDAVKHRRLDIVAAPTRQTDQERVGESTTVMGTTEERIDAGADLPCG